MRDGEHGFGYNAATGQYEDLLATGVIDPTEPVRVALENAVSVAGLLVTTQVVVAERRKKQPEAGASGEPSYDDEF